MSNAHENIDYLIDDYDEANFKNLLAERLQPQFTNQEGYAELDIINMLSNKELSGRLGIPFDKGAMLELLLNQYTREGLPQDFGFKFSKGFK